MKSRREGTAEDSARAVLIGYWKGGGERGWPDPRDFVDASWSADERREVAGYLSNGTVVGECLGLSRCRFCGQHNGHREFTDGMYQWPEGLAHYLWVHEVRLPVAVVAHIKSRLAGFEGGGLDRASGGGQRPHRPGRRGIDSALYVARKICIQMEPGHCEVNAPAREGLGSRQT